jgi:peptidoglycan-N-acetylglucosamine deacetylase
LPAERSPVFYDPTGRRWTRFRRGLQTAGICAALLIVLVAILLFGNVQLPALGLPQVEHLPASFAEVPAIISGEVAARNAPYHMRRAARHIQYVRSSSPVLHPKTAARVSAEKPIVFGFYVNWDPSSMVSLRINLAHLTHLIPGWLTLQNSKGDLADEADGQVIAIARQAKLPILALVSNYRNGWQANDAHRAISDPDARDNLIDNILSNLEEHGLQGVNIDFENLAERDRGSLVEFMRQLYGRLHPQGLLVTQSVPVEDAAFDLKRLAQYNDYLIPMVYDEHYQSSEPGPVASEGWFEDQLERLSKLVPPEKTVIGIGNYGYDWAIGGRGAAEMTFGAVMAAAVANNGQFQWDGNADNPVLRYADGGNRHEVWFLDAVTGLNHAIDVAQAGFRGVGVWRLGAEDPGLWKVLAPGEWPADDYPPAQLAPLSANKSVISYGEGEVLRITETPRDGNRKVAIDSDGNYSETFGQIPTYWVVEKRGKPRGKALALTFDDGPDPEWTPQILDALKQRHVRATFFAIGANAARNIGLIKREYAEGHEIGNHSYDHPNIALVSEERARLELSWTQRIIENALGVATTMFRPPYNADSDPATPEEILPVWRAQQEGYITIAETIDPRDWEKGTTAERLIEDVEADEHEGNVILLHDGGGDRAATLQALPRIIDDFRSRGYEFLPVGELIGRTRAQVMPTPSKEEMRWARLEGQAFGAESNFKKVIGILFLWAIYLTLLRSLVFGALALAQRRRARKRSIDESYRPPVSVIIAAYNEEKVIARTVDSVLHNGYDDLEVVVVNDGSKDATLGILRGKYGSDPRVRILDQPNRGKSNALNNAIAHASHEILVAIDADTIFRRGTIAKLARHFADPRIGAVSGNARVGNRRNWITRFQSIEYIYGFNLDRRALDLLNAITVVPGAAGAWRKPLVQQLGGFPHDTLAEDTDLTLAIRREGYVIRYDDKAVAFTEAPETVRGLAKQRFRWAFGTLQAAWKHRDALFVPRYGSLGFVALPSIWLFQVLLSALAPFAEIAMLLALFAGNWRVVLVYYLGFFLLELATGFVAYALEGEKPGDLRLLFFQRVFYRELMYYVLAKSLLFAMQGRLVGWGKLERRATVEGA